MSDLPFKNKKPGVSALASEYGAMPHRTIVGLAEEGRVALLECGHEKALIVWRHVGETIRCRDCYSVGMLKARWLIGE